MTDYLVKNVGGNPNCFGLRSLAKKARNRGNVPKMGIRTYADRFITVNILTGELSYYKAARDIEK